MCRLYGVSIGKCDSDGMWVWAYVPGWGISRKEVAGGAGVADGRVGGTGDVVYAVCGFIVGFIVSQ